MHQQFYTVIIIAAVIIFGIFRRIRRNIGWQQLNQGRIMFRAILLFIVGIVFLGESISHPVSLVSDVIGIMIGIVLSYYSAGMTRFEQRDRSWYYRPNTWVGTAVIAIFFIRLIYRFYEMYAHGVLSGVQGEQASEMQNMGYAVGNSWTAGFLLIMFAYYVSYYMMLLRKQKHLLQSGE
ncbi:CcdC protein domain-containing protein [Heyndrickxia ginsengihumi]|uniref:DUF1453 family protein n=1 Tax=Heyndrickxia ginsengihumi TaxID=363870 RepID=A0A0A6VEY9_9BACI|nr:CcdC protein domain-containing protein [Heyndrickxia ginsengihumi]KHD85124.1 hypothetical protein NG54_11100 [Heyndrickxia ginsengihumi]MCM3024923.1 DUF1453 family protein [Heyndrickxia ginsengihumi]NEY20144.1 DUF1453 family protein [Heyndrickxia ginsengihumi]